MNCFYQYKLHAVPAKLLPQAPAGEDVLLLSRPALQSEESSPPHHQLGIAERLRLLPETRW